MANMSTRTTKSISAIRPAISGSEALSLSEQIAAQLAESIVHGEYEPGDRIHEIAVSERFQVSRGPVREALRILEKEGLVRIQPRRGAIVTKLTVQEVEDVFEIRSMLLGLAGRRAALKGDKALVEELWAGLRHLSSLLEKDETEDVTDSYLAEVQELNLLLCARTGSERLTSIILSLLHQTLRYSRLGLSTNERRRQSVQNWTRLLKLIEKGDGDGAEAAVHTLVERSKNMAIKLLKEENRRNGTPD
ncbi:GntR family transcriptional regulator [Oceanibacterium hippocampi]|uniref:Putative HTH-type transcriptional regulator YdfH n=1 Tax=Oceanibacterium hippocampi TaxID=745714 RepID=A0A1Y5TXA4_9PROT|nr:GntR family transcriptional regulator [Oceanibacterium hippocampi]SLN75634.1 putative HTH-type transcriptional regulator YdfH [Oceanibacterium hippocampi]